VKNNCAICQKPVRPGETICGTCRAEYQADIESGADWVMFLLATQQAERQRAEIDADHMDDPTVDELILRGTDDYQEFLEDVAEDSTVIPGSLPPISVEWRFPHAVCHAMGRSYRHKA
jgi:hypothetical protein